MQKYTKNTPSHIPVRYSWCILAYTNQWVSAEIGKNTLNYNSFRNVYFYTDHVNHVAVVFAPLTLHPCYTCTPKKSPLTAFGVCDAFLLSVSENEGLCRRGFFEPPYRQLLLASQSTKNPPEVVKARLDIRSYLWMMNGLIRKSI